MVNEWVQVHGRFENTQTGRVSCCVRGRLDEDLSPLVFDFNTLEVTFNWEGQQVTLHGSQEAGECKVVSGKRIQKLFEQRSITVGQLHSIYTMDVGGKAAGDQKHVSHRDKSLEVENGQVHPLRPIHNLLLEFEDMFATPQTLPPHQILDHSIHLKPNNEPVNLKAY